MIDCACEEESSSRGGARTDVTCEQSIVSTEPSGRVKAQDVVNAGVSATGRAVDVAMVFVGVRVVAIGTVERAVTGDGTPSFTAIMET